MKNFETFESLGQNLSNSICQFSNDKSIALQILYPSSVSSKITPLYFLSSKEPIKVKKFVTFESSLQKLSNSLCQLETASRFLSKFCILIQFHEIKLLYTFLAQDIYTLLKRSPLKWKLLRLSSVQVKICQFTYANFEATSRFLCKFCILIQFYER